MPCTHKDIPSPPTDFIFCTFVVYIFITPFRCFLLWGLPVLPSVSFQVARAGRFGTKGLAITFVSDENDAKILNDVQDRFEVNISELPDEIDISSYSEYWSQQLAPPTIVIFLVSVFVLNPIMHVKP